MAEFPCGICKTNCENDTIQCSECELWFHSKCLGMSKTSLKSWSVKTLNYYCGSCSFDGDLYDAGKALKRLEAAVLHSKSKKQLEAAAKNEVKLLVCHKVSFPATPATYQQSDIDDVSVEILLKYHPAYIEENVPLKTVGDGNCLYRAISKHMTGSEMYHKLLRLETALELIVFRDRYEPKCTNGLEFLSDSRIVTSSTSKLIEDAVKLGSYSELAHIYAASAALKQPIRSYYPPQLHPELTSEPFTRTVVGRDVKHSNVDICIMWTNACVPSQTKSFSPNHFVPIVSKQTRSMSTPICVDIDTDVTVSTLTNDISDMSNVHVDITVDGDVSDTVMTVEETDNSVTVDETTKVNNDDDDDDDEIATISAKVT